MNKDYAKRRTYRKRSAKKSYWKLWVFTVFFFLVFIAGLLFIGKHQISWHNVIKFPTRHAKKVSVPIKKVVPPPAVAKPTTLPQFDFYKILPQKKITGTIPEYDLEIALVKDYSAADHYKAELALLGFAVKITTLHVSDTAVYRVAVGPYDNKEGALADQKLLKQNKIKSTLRKIK
jgi:hypothetical protein